MAKITDAVAVFLAAFLLQLMLFCAVFEKMWQAAVVALLSTALLVAIFLKFRSRDGKRPYALDKFNREMALLGNENIIKLLLSALNSSGDPTGSFALDKKGRVAYDNTSSNFENALKQNHLSSTKNNSNTKTETIFDGNDAKTDPLFSDDVSTATNKLFSGEVSTAANPQFNSDIGTKIDPENSNINNNNAPKFNAFEKGGYIVLSETAAILPLYKFSDISPEDIAKSYRFVLASQNNDLKTSADALQKDCFSPDKIYLLGRGISRDALILSESLPIEFVFVKPARLMTYMRKMKVLPPLTIKTKKRGNGFANLVRLVFQRRNAKYFLFSGVMLSLMSFLTPLKTYYIVTASISLFAALLSLLLPSAQRQGKRHTPFL